VIPGGAVRRFLFFRSFGTPQANLTPQVPFSITVPVKTAVHQALLPRHLTLDAPPLSDYLKSAPQKDCFLE